MWLWQLSRSFRTKTQVPLVIMTYINLFINMWYWSQLSWPADTSVKGSHLICQRNTLTLSPLYLKDSDIALVPSGEFDYSRTWPSVAVDWWCSSCFIHAVAINGVTGTVLPMTFDNTWLTWPPMQTFQSSGFGVSTEDDIKRFNAVSDGVIVDQNRPWPRRKGRRSRWICYLRFTLWK